MECIFYRGISIEENTSYLCFFLCKITEFLEFHRIQIGNFFLNLRMSYLHYLS